MVFPFISILIPVNEEPFFENWKFANPNHNPLILISITFTGNGLFPVVGCKPHFEDPGVEAPRDHLSCYCDRQEDW